MEWQRSKRFTAAASARKAAVVVGVAFLVSVVFVTWVDDFLLANFVVPGDTSALARDIDANPTVLLIASLGYLVVLTLDAIVGVGLYIVLRPANKRLATLTAAFRLLYVVALVIGIFALLFQAVDAYGYASIKLVGYFFFACHIFTLGYSVFLSGYIPKSLGVFLMFASLTYAVFFIDIPLPDYLLVLTMLTMALAEIALCVWLLVKRKNLPETGSGDVVGTV